MRLNIFISAALFVFTFAVFWPVTGYDFVNFDDPGYVSRNQVVKKGFTAEGVKWAFTTNEGGNWHPVTWFSHMLDCQLFGLKAGRQHAVSVALHGASVVLLFLLMTHLTGARWRSAVLAALFAVHPLRVESVAWISERKDVLSGFFFMLTLWAYVKWTEVAKEGTSGVWNRKLEALRWFGLSLVLFAFGLMSKPMLVTLPCVLVLLDWWPLQRIGKFTWRAFAASILEKAPFFALTAAFSVITVHAQGSAHAVVSFADWPLKSRLATAVVAFAQYLGKTVIPTSLGVLYPHTNLT